MSHLEPRQIYNEFLAGKIDKFSTISYFISFIENSIEEMLRIDAMKFLSKLGIKSDFYFKYLENILISDDNNLIKAYAAKSLIIYFSNRAFRTFNRRIRKTHKSKRIKSLM